MIVLSPKYAFFELFGHTYAPRSYDKKMKCARKK